jgi:hypothetical protein
MRRKFNSEEERKVEVKKYKKEYHQSHQEEDKMYQVKYRNDHKEKLLSDKKEYYQNNKEKILTKAKKYYQINKEEKKKKTKEYYQNNKEEILMEKKEYGQTHKKEKNEYINNRLKINIDFKLAHYLRSRLRNAIKRNQKSGSAVKDLGCTIPFFKLYLEALFKPGMSWNNWSFRGWHIDHIKPLDSFNLQNREEFLKAVHYTNLQPLWAKENLIKGNNIFIK